MNSSNADPLPIESWSSDMQAAITQICELGQATLATHRKASPQAEKVADDWKLAQRLEDERVALTQLFESARSIIEAVEKTRQKMHAGEPSTSLHEPLQSCATIIDEHVPVIERSFLTGRHSALDLLRWTQRSGHLEGSELPSQYRASYAQLVAYTPVFKPRMETMQQELLALRHEPELHHDIQRLVAALSRYNGIAESARRFVHSVVHPPLDLVFHDTDTFQSDWNQLTQDVQSQLGTEINDCCQLLLYDQPAFNDKVDHLRPALVHGIEASLYVLAVETWRVLFTVDEDPVFKELTVTLLRVIQHEQFDEACDAVIQSLYHDLTQD